MAGGQLSLAHVPERQTSGKAISPCSSSWGQLTYSPVTEPALLWGPLSRMLQPERDRASSRWHGLRATLPACHRQRGLKGEGRHLSPAQVTPQETRGETSFPRLTPQGSAHPLAHCQSSLYRTVQVKGRASSAQFLRQQPRPEISA